MMRGIPLILASASPRRRQILALLGLPFEVVAPGLDEASMMQGEEEPRMLAERLALRKAEMVGAEGGIVVAADTLVICEEAILGKPKDGQEVLHMLRLLREREHWVITGVAAINTDQGCSATAHAATKVVMRSFSEAELQAYLASGQPWDKAGAYAIQDRLLNPVASYEGCYLNVVGLPLCKLAPLLPRVGLDPGFPPPEELWQECSFCANWKAMEGRVPLPGQATAPQFYGREIEVATAGEVRVPISFRLGEQEFAISEVLEAWQDYGFGPLAPQRRRWWQRRHRNYFRVRTTDGAVFEIYYDRSGGIRHPERRKWFLYRQLGGS